MKLLSGDRTGSPTGSAAADDWNRPIRVGLVFLAFEAVILTILGGLFLGELDSAVLFLAVAGAGGIGYLLLGLLTGTWVSIVFVLLPIVIAVPVGGTLADGSSASETALYVSWTYLSVYFFAPAWLLGLLISLVRRQYPSDPA